MKIALASKAKFIENIYKNQKQKICGEGGIEAPSG